MEKVKELGRTALRWVLALALAALVLGAVGPWAVAHLTTVTGAFGLSGTVVATVVVVLVALAAVGAAVTGWVFDTAKAAVEFAATVANAGVEFLRKLFLQA